MNNVKNIEPDTHFENYLETLRCSVCHSDQLMYSSNPHSFNCNSCNEVFEIKEGIVDSIKNLSEATKNELIGMALENGFSKEEFKDFQVTSHENLPGFAQKFELSKNDHSHYYMQTKMNFDQAYKLLDDPTNKKVLEIGSCHDYYFLEPFEKNGCDCYALNIHFQLNGDKKYESWPKKVIGDMNDLPFKDKSFDIVVISAASHHSTTPEKLISEIYRVLDYGGQCLVINDPTWGIIKNLGGPDNTLAFRESHINENEYPIWRYNKMFKSAGLEYKHLFSDYYNHKLMNLKIQPGERFAFVARIIQPLWKIDLLRKVFIKFFRYWAQAIFGFPMNVVLSKKKNKLELVK